MIEDVLQVWRVHEEINLFLFERIPEAGFHATGRTVARIFAHMHGVRVAHVGRDFPHARRSEVRYLGALVPPEAAAVRVEYAS